MTRPEIKQVEEMKGKGRSHPGGLFHQLCSASSLTSTPDNPFPDEKVRHPGHLIHPFLSA